MKPYVPLAEMARRLDAIIDDGRRVLRDDETDNWLVMMRLKNRRCRAYYFRSDVGEAEVDELQRDIRDLHDHVLRFQAKWEKPRT